MPLRFLSILACVLFMSCGSTEQAGPSPAPTPETGRTTASVLGVVSGDGARRLGGATVQVTGGPNAGQSTTADIDGLYRFDALTIGSSATITARATGYAERSSTITVAATGNTLNFALTPQ